MKANCTCHKTSPRCCHSNVDESGVLKVVLMYECYLHSAAHKLKTSDLKCIFFLFSTHLSLKEVVFSSSSSFSFFMNTVSIRWVR